MKLSDLTKQEFKHICERDVDVGPLSLLDFCIEKFRNDENIDLYDNYASDRGIEELLSCLWVSRKELIRLMRKCGEDEFLEDNEAEIDDDIPVVPEIKITQATVRKAITQILARYPDAGDNGLIKNHGDKPLWFFSYDPDFFNQVNTAFKYLTIVINEKGIRNSPTGMNSYSFKHDAEQWGKIHGMEPYVCNMAGIVAMWIHPLVQIESVEELLKRDSPNPNSNIPDIFPAPQYA